MHIGDRIGGRVEQRIAAALRFAQRVFQAAQLAACVKASAAGVEVIPVWNKSNREHTIIGSEPTSTRTAADAAVKELGWTKPYFLDADHINLKTVQRFLDPCDFFTLDVAEMIGKPVDISVTSVLQTASGKMIFGKLDENGKGGDASRPTPMELTH